MSDKLRTLAATVVVTVLLDQLSKLLVVANLGLADRVPVVDGFFYLTHVRNPGAAFGLFAETSVGLRMLSFVVVSLVAMGVIASFFRKLAPGDRRSAFALGLILGGAIGNFTDRIFRQEVIDFVHFRLWHGYAWPDFNLADTFIIMGVGALILELLSAEAASRVHPSDIDG